MIAMAAAMALLFGLLIAAPARSDGRFAIRAVATAGLAAPGGGSFERFSVESLPIVAPVNRRGQVAFFATLVRAGGSEGIFLSSGGRMVRIAGDGDASPGGGTLTGFGRHPVPALNDSGTVAFAAAVASGTAVEGIFAASRGRLQVVALTGGAAPGIPSGTLAGLDIPAINDRGDVAFLATVRRGRETIEAIYVRTGGKLIKVVAQGDPAPAGGAFAGFGAPALNNRGLVTFAAIVEGRAVPGGIFQAQGGAIKMLVGAGEETPLGGIFMRFSERVALNDAGLVAFQAALKNGPVPAAIFAVEGNRVRRVAAIGDAAPEGGSFSHFGPWPAVDAGGEIGFAASVDGGPSPLGVFLAGPMGLSRVVAIGDALPGGKLTTLTLYPVVSLGDAGGITFAAAPSPTGEGAEGIYLAIPSR